MVDTIITAIVVPLLAVAVAVAGLTYNACLNRKTQYLSTLEKFDDELRSIELSQKRCDDYVEFAWDYLDELNKIAYLTNKRIISKAVALYYKEAFSAALGMLSLPEIKSSCIRFNDSTGKCDDVKDLNDLCSRIKLASGKPLKKCKSDDEDDGKNDGK